MATAQASGTLAFLHRVRSLPTAARWLLAGVCATRLSAYMVWPFVAVMMNQRFGSSITEIGAQLSLGALITILLGPLAGMLGDLFNRTHMLLVGCTLSFGAFTLMGFYPHPATYFAAILATALANSLIEPLLRARLGETVDGDEQRSFLFHLRYYLVNLAVAFGPMLGFWFANRQHDGVYALAALASAFLAGIVWKVGATSVHKTPEGSQPSMQASPWHIVQAVIRHRAFMTILLANFLLIFIYAQAEDPLTFYLIELEVSDINETIALLNVTNTVVVLVFHLALMGWLAALSERRAYVLALGFLMVSQFIIAANVAAWQTIWLLAIGFATLAEIVVMPLFTVMIDKIAPPDMRGSFFGVAMLAGLGGGIAPFLGAFAISQLGGVAFFALLGVACLPIGCFGYWHLRETNSQAPV